ncbi:uncharacterized protein PITG_06843 [Phytophthora infestans T30-4]|uniref:Uncharacterized protein n=1 Tax=Phytophthora infestans (strain T30-4) TaxID=403677 RepID=D0N6K9_PHYIT|nr:uncharacterized protein PITG_06843 [Phytophthora infestans T30-4]EEY53208.1 hypothetical protein PITG_06843 [Phytophthora infestans T30-4]|eukprot:XP_002904826.1 hypothetical protein PITG_06843 [Phytophthora infestans T30-4]
MAPSRPPFLRPTPAPYTCSPLYKGRPPPAKVTKEARRAPVSDSKRTYRLTAMTTRSFNEFTCITKGAYVRLLEVDGTSMRDNNEVVHTEKIERFY